jgi:hypothetical protein
MLPDSAAPTILASLLSDSPRPKLRPFPIQLQPYVFTLAPHEGPAPNAAAAITVWKVANDAYQTQRSALDGLVRGILDSLDEHPLRLITEPAWGTQRQTFLTIITILDDANGTATAADLTPKAGLSTLKDGTTIMREFCAHHRQILRSGLGAGAATVCSPHSTVRSRHSPLVVGHSSAGQPNHR